MQLFLCSEGGNYRFFRETLGRLLDRYIGQQAIPVEVVLSGSIEVLSGGRIVLTGDEVWWYHLPGVDVGFAHPEVIGEKVGFKSLMVRITNSECDEYDLTLVIMEVVDRLRRANCDFRLARLRRSRRGQMSFRDPRDLNAYLLLSVQTWRVNAEGDEKTLTPLDRIKVG